MDAGTAGTVESDAADFVLEVGDFQRFQRAVQLGTWLGLVPSRQQSSESDSHGPITKTGARYARRILVDASWHYLRVPRVGVTLAARHDGLPDHVFQIAWRAQHRLYPSTAACARTANRPTSTSPADASSRASSGPSPRPMTPA